MAIVNTPVSQTYARFLSLVWSYFLPASRTLSTGGGAVTLTAAEVLGGLLVVDTQDAQTATLPTATLIAAALPGGIQVGSSVQFYVRNVGDSVLTIAVGAGITSATGNTLTIAAVTTRPFLLRCTAVAVSSDPASAYTFTLYSLGVGLH
jgi:hypothetical protein